MPTFEPPTRKEYGQDRLYGRYGVQVGISLVWNGAHFVEQPYPWLGEIADLEDGVTYFLGGHVYEVSEETADLLIADGFEVSGVEDSGTVTLTVTADGINGSEVVGSGALWSDDSDATYATAVAHADGLFSTGIDVEATAITELEDTPTAIRFIVRVSGTGPVASSVFAADLYDDSNTISTVESSLTLDDSAHEITFTVAPDDLGVAAAILSTFNSNNASLLFGFGPPTDLDSGEYEAKVYEVRIEVDVA